METVTQTIDCCQIDLGPDGSIGNRQWIVGALPGASLVGKEASYTNDQGRLQGAARVGHAARQVRRRTALDEFRQRDSAEGSEVT